MGDRIRARRLKIAALSGTSTLPAASGTLTHVSGAPHTSAIRYSAAAAEPASCFWDAGTNTFSFQQWCRRNGFPGIDALYVLLGWNGLPYPTANLCDPVQHAQNIGYAQVLIDRFHADYPSAVVRVLGMQLPSVTGGLGASYGGRRERSVGVLWDGSHGEWAAPGIPRQWSIRPRTAGIAATWTSPPSSIPSTICRGPRTR